MKFKYLKVPLLELVIVAALIDSIAGESKKPSKQRGHCKQFVNKNCPSDLSEIYSEKKSERGTVRLCCTKNSQAEDEQIGKATGCQVTDCLENTHDDEIGMCRYLPQRTVKKKVVEYVEILRDDCGIHNDGEEMGMKGLCCPKASKEGALAVLLGAELHQFPHYAFIHIQQPNGDTAYCGGTIYNERYIITASHCMLENGTVKNVMGSGVTLDVRISNGDSNNKHEIEEFIPHPDSSLWKGSPVVVKNDVGLVKLRRKIKFGPNIKALPIAPPGFNPFLYSNETVIIGAGYTDTLRRASLLQRATVLLRDDRKNIEGNRLWKGGFKMNEAESVLFAGGIQDGKSSPRSAKGDSGGPAICRDEKGLAVLCGIDSAGPDLEICDKSLNEYDCKPLVYMEVQYYNEWIEGIAGNQKKAQVLKQPLFGGQVGKKRYQHQVHITSRDGTLCGGTLIKKDVVLTAAHCVVDDKKRPRRDVKVFTGVRDVKSDKGTNIDVKKVEILDGFHKTNQGQRSKRIARLNVMPTPMLHFYRNDLALLKLSRRANIDDSKLPTIGPCPTYDGNIQVTSWSTEISLPANTSISGKLQQREFQLLDGATCQKRLDKLGPLGINFKLDDNIMCGQEKYNGGAQCDRELGGGLFHKDDNGKDIFCGVQVFRFCQLALPSAFLDVNQHSDWIEQNGK